MRPLLLLVFTFLFVSNYFAFHPVWTFMDKRLIKDIAHLDLNNPKKVESYFKKHNKRISKEKLGFSWEVWSTGKAAGTISIGVDFYYFNDSLVCYKIYPELPEEKERINRYRKWYGSQFNYIEDKIVPYEYNCETIYSPLDVYYQLFPDVLLSEKSKKYMSPESGLTYGYAGGYNGGILPNRKAFLELRKDSLTVDQVTCLMYAKNPTSRFTAMEWYLQNRTSFSDTILLDEWIQRNLKEVPVCYTLNGCFGRNESSDMLLYIYSQMKLED
ncbi:MAG: hypothetical protein QE487_15675 [Fluviicola sp.]|nr:hypothetical protein [Fluviicola sp.]